MMPMDDAKFADIRRRVKERMAERKLRESTADALSEPPVEWTTYETPEALIQAIASKVD